MKNVTDKDDLMVINKSGITIRIGVNTLREMGRATQGVKIIRLKDEDSIASVAKVSRFEVQENDLEGDVEIMNTDDILEEKKTNNKNEPWYPQIIKVVYNRNKQ